MKKKKITPVRIQFGIVNIISNDQGTNIILLHNTTVYAVGRI